MNTKLAAEAFKIGVEQALKFFASLTRSELPKQLGESAKAVLEATAKAAENIPKNLGK